jgi:hypothetical protein
MKMYGELKVKFHEFLTWTLDGDELLASCSGLFALPHPVNTRLVQLGG